jgi:D-3-phosphoglycerate dehydrogenase
MLLSARDIIEGINWVATYNGEEDIAKATEKEKSNFSGTELSDKKFGVIGLGAIGVMVANTATHLGMKVCGFDPYVSVDSAWQLSRQIIHAQTMDEIFKECDYISIHVPTNEDTKDMINQKSLSLMKDGVTILNFSRDSLVNSEDVIEALDAGKIRKYVTDFPTTNLAGVKGVIMIPHLGASTEESEDNCAKMAVKQVKEYLENGNIINSVNFPNCNMGKKGDAVRITILHENVPDMLRQFTEVLADKHLNISDMTNKSYKKYAYTMIDIDGEVCIDVEEALAKIKSVLRVRIIK